MNPGSSALARGLRVLIALSEESAGGDGLGVTRLAAKLGVDKSQMSRTLQTLEEYGFVERSRATHGYHLGWRTFAIAARAGNTRLLVAAPPIMRALVRTLGESVHLSVRQGEFVLTLLTESPPAALHAPGRVGSLTPIASTSAGRALLCDVDQEELVELGLESLVPQLAEVAKRGYAIVKEEFEPGLVAAAAPIHGPAGVVVAALNASGPSFRFEDRLEEAGSLLVTAAAELSAVLRGEREALPRDGSPLAGQLS